MSATGSSKNLYSYLKKGNFFADLSKKVFSANQYHNSTYYEAILAQNVNLSNYINIYTNSINLSSVHTNVDIQADVLGAESKSLINKYGKPEYIFTEHNISVLVYKWKFNDIKTRCEIHCYDGKAFLVNYVYEYLLSHEKSYVIDTITQKYLGQCVNKVDLFKSKVTCKNNNVLFIDNFLMGFKVTYMSNSEGNWFEAMFNKIQQKKNKEQASIRFGEMSFYNSI